MRRYVESNADRQMQEVDRHTDEPEDVVDKMDGQKVGQWIDNWIEATQGQTHRQIGAWTRNIGGQARWMSKKAQAQVKKGTDGGGKGQAQRQVDTQIEKLTGGEEKRKFNTTRNKKFNGNMDRQEKDRSFKGPTDTKIG